MKFPKMNFAPEDGGGAPPAGVTAPAPSAVATPVALPAAGAPLASPAAYWPEGLDAALRGTDEKTTLDNVAKTLKGYRDRDASRNVPATVDDYLKFENAKDFKIDPQYQAHFDILKDDTAFKSIAASAHKHGVGQTAMMEMYQSGLTAMSEAGLLEPPLDAAAELAALVPDAAKSLSKEDQNAAATKRMNENYDFLTLAQTNMGLPKEASDYAEMMLGDSAKGHGFFEWMRGRLQGANAGPGAHGQNAGGDTREALRTEMAALKPNDPQFAQKNAALDARYKALIGN